MLSTAPETTAPAAATAEPKTFIGGNGAPALAGVDPVTVNVEQLMTLSGLGKSSIYGLIKSGDLKSVTFGRRRLVVFATYKAYIARQLAAS